MATDNFKFNYDNREICLVDLLPQIYTPIYDFRALSNASGTELSKLYQRVRSLLDDQFITTCSLDTLIKWEKYLKLTPNPTDTVTERRFRVLANFKDIPPYTRRYLKKRLDELCGEGNWRWHERYNEYCLVIEVSVDSPTNKRTIERFVRNIVPANIEVIVRDYSSEYGELSIFTHGKLSEYTHGDIKNGEPFK